MSISNIRPWKIALPPLSCVAESTKSQFAILSEKFHKPGENHLTDGYIVTPNTKELLQKHLQETGGKVITRFPPEPNGYLHIGHAMAMNFNFSYAQAHGGVTYLRYDDTNPETMQAVCVKDILEMVQWLGYSPYKVTHSSDYFAQLYDYARRLILSGHAYVCHQPLPQCSPWKDRPIEESLQLFEDMRNGRYKEGEATLRMKIVLADGKLDPVAYRIKATPHPRTGHEWCIYPTYDYSHCLCDSIENITHSFCSKEFMIKRNSYYWLCNALGIYCPVQWEFSRLNVNHTLLSKRKIQKLLKESVIKDWDDPRLYTLSGLRRRGFPAEAITAFTDQYGVLQSDGQVDVKLIDHYVRKHLDQNVNRVMSVVNPIKVTITNFPWGEDHVVEAPNNRNKSSAGTRSIPFRRVIYIERSDFREDCPEGYRRLTPQQEVGLKYARCTLELERVERDPETGSPVELYVSCHPQEPSSPVQNKPKAYIHWLSQPIPCALRFYQQLSDQVSNESLKEIGSALVEASVLSSPPGTKFQFERIGYFCVDKDSTPNKLVFNSTLSLQAKQDNIWTTLPNYF